MPNRALLIVDDEENVRHALKRSLRRENYLVHTAANPEEGLDLLERESIDLVISDYSMPQMTGLQFLKLVHDRYPDIERIMLTGHADSEIASQAINEAQIYRLLTKPWDEMELKVLLRLAFTQYELQRQNRRLLAAVREQAQLINELARQFPQILAQVRSIQGSVALSDDELRALVQ